MLECPGGTTVPLGGITVALGGATVPFGGATVALGGATVPFGGAIVMLGCRLGVDALRDTVTLLLGGAVIDGSTVALP